MPASRAASQRPADEQPTPADGRQPSEAQSSPRASGGSSPGSSAAGSPFFADAGPGFDADEAEAAAEPISYVEAPELVLWTPERVRRILVLQGKLTHTLVGVATTDWVWLDDELDLVCGPLADHANRVPALAALAHVSDDAAIAAGFVTYAMRSWLERTREIQRRRAEAPAQPVTGRAPDPEDVEGLKWTTPNSP